MFLLEILILKGLTVQCLYKSFGIKGLTSTLDGGKLSPSCPDSSITGDIALVLTVRMGLQLGETLQREKSLASTRI
jgi:hypothetical protein